MRRRHLLVFMVCGAVGLMGACGDESLPAPLDRPDANIIARDAVAEATPAGTVADSAVVDDDAEVDAASADADAAVTDASTVVELGGACNARAEAPADAGRDHVGDGTPITHASNPPSSGVHYDSWASFQEFSHPVEDGYLVHALEHGAVLLLYQCNAATDAGDAGDGGDAGDAGDASAGDCDAVRAQLRAVRDAIPTDPMCSAGIRVRVIIAPRATNDAPIAASAWGHTYKADCVDPTTLGQFITAHYAKAPENFCFPGSIF